MALPQETMICPKCNYKIPEDSEFCQACRVNLASAAASAPLTPDDKLRLLFSNVEEWEIRNFYPRPKKSPSGLTEQQRQEELQRRIQSAQDIAIQNRIAAMEAANKRNKIFKIILFSLLAIGITAYCVINL